jgi:hypothetical protein
MKKFTFVLAMLAVALVLGLALAGCKSEVDDPLNGMYVGNEDDTKLILNNGSWTIESVDGNRRGTYTANEGTIKFTTTDFYFTPEWAAEANTTAGWKNKSQFTEIAKGMGLTDAQINDFFASFTGTYTGNTISFGGGGGFTRQ